ncbi:MAG: acetate kinase [Pseudodesulfovibrio sp.]
MKILVINCGSSSLKYQLLDMSGGSVIATGVIERIGEEMGSITQQSHPDNWPNAKSVEHLPILNHDAAMRLMVDKLVGEQWGVIGSLREIDAIGHRVVQGGEVFSTPVLVDEDVVRTIRANIPLAPLHGANLTGIEVALELFHDTPNVVVFDTEFHQTIPRKAFMYPIPMELYTEFKVRKYGFHGTSHKYVSKAAAAHLGKPLAQLDLITVHLGNGCSMAAVKQGRCVDTTMGLTPLAGLMMGTRCGDVDPAIHAFVAKHRKMSLAEVDAMLNKQSGLLGICGMNDMRDIHAAREKGDENAQLAFEMFAYRVKATIGAYLAVLGRADAIVFTAGIGENDAHVRAQACEGLEGLGICLAPEKNSVRAPGARTISGPESRVAVLVVPTNEELEIAQAAQQIVNG